MRIASIDIGTNTVRLLICETTRGGGLDTLYLDREITRLGEGFNSDERLIKPAPADRTLGVLRGYSALIDDYGAERVRAVATSVVRSSRNHGEFVERIESETGLQVEIITGASEAQLTADGALKSVGYDGPECVIIDIGGGSTEYIKYEAGSLTNLTSLNIGVVHLAEQYLVSGDDTKEELRSLSGRIADELNSGLKSFTTASFGTAGNTPDIIATAGTPTTFAAMDLGLDNYDPALVNGHNMSLERIALILKHLTSIPRDRRSSIKGLEKGREDIIIPGGLILLESLDYFSKKSLIVSDGGLLEGIAYSLIRERDI